MKKIISPSPKAVVAMSGGVDSTTTALLLKQQGFEVTGMHMRLWKERGSALEARARAEEENVRHLAREMGIGFKLLDLRREFKQAVVDYFLSSYESGRTPNPCIRCNREIKFGLLFTQAMELGADYFATGHYARIKPLTVTDQQGRKKKQFRLLQAKDLAKDQSYFLYNLDQKILARTLFPLGDFSKPEVRAIAERNGLPVFDKAESQEVCFIADKYYGEFLKRMHAQLEAGEIVDEAGRVLGQHLGLPLYTLGQRRDIRIGGTGPYFVVGMDRRLNRLIVSRKAEDERLYARAFTLREINWTRGRPEDFPWRAKVKTRYRMDAVPAQIMRKGNRLVVRLERKSRAVMPGQSAVFYRRGEVRGGGVIDRIQE